MMGDDGFIVRVRGLPWSVTQDEIVTFFTGCEILGGTDGIHFTYVRDGRPSGEAYVELANSESLTHALSKDQNNLGKRYIEVFESKRSEMDWVVKRSGSSQGEENTDAVVRLRGLPYGCSKEEVANFFTGMEIVPNGITLLEDGQGRSTGDAYVQFASQALAERAQGKHKEKIGHRYIEIFKSSLSECKHAENGGGFRGGRGGMGGRPGPYDRMERFGGGDSGMRGGMGGGYGRGRGRGNVKGFYEESGYEDYNSGYAPSYAQRGGGGGTRGGLRRGGLSAMSASDGYGRYGEGGHMERGEKRGPGAEYDSSTGHYIHMRGLPFAAVESDIRDFFKPLNPVVISIHQNSDGRASGEADVEFATHGEAKEGMGKNKESMQHRYIELFVHSTTNAGGGGGGYGGMVGGQGGHGPMGGHGGGHMGGHGGHMGGHGPMGGGHAPPMGMGSMGGEYGPPYTNESGYGGGYNDFGYQGGYS